MTEQEYRELQQRADRICSLILIEEYPAADIAVERSLLRSEVADRFPESLELCDRIFESRFERLWEQFRGTESSRDEPDAGQNHAVIGMLRPPGSGSDHLEVPADPDLVNAQHRELVVPRAAPADAVAYKRVVQPRPATGGTRRRPPLH